MKKSLIILSGGMDSTTLLYLLKRKQHLLQAVSFNYGSKHNNQEYKYAKKTCKNLSIPLYRIPLTFINDYFKSDLLKKGGDIPEGHYADKSMEKTVVPFRNGIMLSIAAGLAESLGFDEIALGNHFGDHAIYPDCRSSFIKPMAEAIIQGTYKKITLNSPFASITKTDIVKLGNDLHIDWQDTYSCYKGGFKHCGVCGTCVERKEAFLESNTVDPTKYEKGVQNEY